MKGKAINICPAACKTLMSSFLAFMNLNLKWGPRQTQWGFPCSVVCRMLQLGMACSKLFHRSL